MMRTFQDKTYRPLPDSVTIMPSSIDGLGLHAIEDLQAGTVLGETHVLVHDKDRLEWVRTPLGGFINHSDDPNCMRIQKDNRWELLTIKNIIHGEELTLCYTMYKPELRPIDLDDYESHTKKVFKGKQ